MASDLENHEERPVAAPPATQEKANGKRSESKTAEAKAAALLKDAQARADEQKRIALQESSKEIARAAMLAAEKILRESNV